MFGDDTVVATGREPRIEEHLAIRTLESKFELVFFMETRRIPKRSGAHLVECEHVLEERRYVAEVG